MWSAHIFCVLALLGGLRAGVGAELTGVVRDNLGNALSNLTVKATLFDPFSDWISIVTTTDDTGHFSFLGESDSWTIEVPPAELNARGYLSVSSSYLDLLDVIRIRLVTRKLDFTHRIIGRLADEAGQPLAGYALRARITENGALFETNVVTGTDGSFLLGATPAVWTFFDLAPVEDVSTVHVLGEALVEVDVTSIEKRATIIAPTATSTILVTPTNLRGLNIVVESEAFGRTYRLLKTVPWEETPLTFEVFNGVWRLSVTKEGTLVTQPAPLLVAVTNQGVSVMLAGVTSSGPTLYPQRVRLVTESGSVVSNAYVFSSPSVGSSILFQPPQPPQARQPPLPPRPPGVHDLQLPEGRWTIIASTRDFPHYGNWDVSREVVVTTNSPLPEITLVFPEPGVGPRLFGTLSASGGPPDASHLVFLQMTNNGTNVLASLITDALGQFGTNVPPGRWEVQTYANCPLVSAVVVSNADVEVNFAFLVPVAGEAVPVGLNVVDDRGEPEPDAWVVLSGFDYQYLPADPLLSHPVPPAIWSVSLANNNPFYIFMTTPTYQIYPTLRWQLPPGVTTTNLVLVTRHTTSRIEGRIRDEQGRLLMSGNAAAWTSVNGTNFRAYSSVASGYFALNVFPGEWQVGAAVSSGPYVGTSPVPASAPASVKGGQLLSYYTRPAPQFVQVTNDVAYCEFVATNVPDRLTLSVTLIREDGGPVEGVYIFANGPIASQYSTADLNGAATLSILPGPHQISARRSVYDVDVDPQLWPVLSADVSAPSNHVVLVARRPATCIPGTIFNAPSLGLQPQLFASTEFHGTNYSITVCPDADGHYCAPAFPGQWIVAINSSTLPGNGIQSVAPREVTVPQTGATPRADFTLAPIVDDFRTARFSRPVLLPDGRLRLELEGQAPLTWRIERSENLRDWTLVAIQSISYRSLIIEEPPEPSRQSAFYRAVWVR